MFKLELKKAEEPERDQIANICWIIEKARELKKKNINFCFMDYTKAIDSCESQQTVENS